MKRIKLNPLDIVVKTLFTITASPVLLVIFLSGLITSIIAIKDHEFLIVFNSTLQLLRNSIKRIWCNGSYKNVMDSFKKET